MDLESQQRPNISRASYGVSIVCIWRKLATFKGTALYWQVNSSSDINGKMPWNITDDGSHE